MRVGVVFAVAVALAAGVSTAHASTQPRPCMHVHTVAGVRYDTFCGPASVTFHIGATAHHVAGGYCYVDPNGHFHMTAGSVDAERMVGSALNKTLRLPFFSLETISPSHGGRYAQAELFYALPGDHPPGHTSPGPAKVTVVGGSHGNFTVPYAQPALSGTFHC